jgi:hypothetical protein
LLKTTFQNKFLFLQNSRFFPYVYIDFKRTLPRQEGKKRGKKRVKMPSIQYPSQENPDAAKLVAHCKFWNPICEPPICNPKTLHHLRPKPKEKKICAAAMDVITQSSPCLSSDIKPRKIALVDVIMQA